MEHEIWRPIEGSKGIEHQRICIVGYSHHYSDHDRATVTTETLHDFISGRTNPAFFRKIQGYFGYWDREQFWNQVHFFDFLPRCIGDGSNKYGTGTKSDHHAACDRVRRILAAEPIDKLFVFTTKGWRNFPHTVEEQAGRPCAPLFRKLGTPTWGTYESKGRTVLACGFQHPQYAKTEVMKQSVEKFLSI